MFFKTESEFEDAVIKCLTEEKGWKDGVLKYKTEKDLIKNWADIIFKNNREIDKLGDCPVTDGEMQQIMEQINKLRTPLALNGFINGKTVQIIRDNENDKHNFGKLVSLKIFDRAEIAAGRTVYQIAQQPVYTAKSDMLPNRRGDFCLLINGMPVIHVELKKSGVPVSEAQYQIQKYLHEGVFTGLFSLVQIFVAMNPEECTYFANPGSADKFRKNLCFHWADKYNEPINAWDQIADKLLSIPMAHQMIGYYTVADTSDNNLKVMRSYQYYAANKICDRITKMKWEDKNIYGGYVWHTTGSGKTMTSFKSAQLIANSGDADKVVFLMDRIELGTQSLREYRGFADETDSVQSTENTQVLISKLRSDAPSDTLIVTSIQKMSRIKYDEGTNTDDIEKINKKRIVFIVDECHRSVFGEMLSTIKFTFPGAVFIGFSGTPILDTNKKKNSTTADVFGDELEGTRYTVADGMRDGNVLGFDSIPQPTYRDKDLRKEVALKKANARDLVDVFADNNKIDIYRYWTRTVPMGEERDDTGHPLDSIEGELIEAQYNNPDHRSKVVEDILDCWTEQSNNGKFHAMLATSSIPEAIEYYKLFKSKKCSLKITAVFDPSDGNNERSIEKTDGIAEILTDYNAMFDTNFNIPGYINFKRDVCSRLAHKDNYKAIENEPDKCLDILIVVDQMLTGFDSKWLNTLYMDKFYSWNNIEMIIQAFSRTNRVFTDDKPHGIIRYYRRPYTMKNIIAYAFEQYSGNKAYGIFVLKLKDNLKAMNDAFKEIKYIFTNAGISDFEKLPDDQSEKAKFASLFKKLNKHLEPAKVQGFVWDKTSYDFISDDGSSETVTLDFNEEIYNTLLQRYKELRRGGSGGEKEAAFDIDPYLMSLSTDKIDADYMNSRFKKYIKSLSEEIDEESRKDVLNELHRSFAALNQDEQKYAHIIIRDIQNSELIVEDTKTFRDYIIEYQKRARIDMVHVFATRLGINEQALRDFMELHVTEEDINAFGRYDALTAQTDIDVAQAYFEGIEGKPLPKRIVKRNLDNKLREFILQGGFEI